MKGRTDRFYVTHLRIEFLNRDRRKVDLHGQAARVTGVIHTGETPVPPRMHIQGCSFFSVHIRLATHVAAERAAKSARRADAGKHAPRLGANISFATRAAHTNRSIYV